MSQTCHSSGRCHRLITAVAASNVAAALAGFTIAATLESWACDDAAPLIRCSYFYRSFTRRQIVGTCF